MVYLIDIGSDLGGLQTTLQQVYDAMIVHCSDLIGLSSSIAGFGALWYAGERIWLKMAKAEKVEPEAIARPFIIGLAIFLFPGVIALINGVMQPTVTGTAALFTDANQAVATLLQQKGEALKNSTDWQMYTGSTGSGDLDKWEALSGEADSGFASGVSNRLKFEMAKISYNMKGSVKIELSEVLQVLFEAAALCIDTVRTFYLIVLGILGPLAFGLSVYPGFENNLTNWLARYLNVFLWLPVANIFGSLIAQIQQQMIRLDIAQLSATGQTSFGSTDTAYLIFLLMAIVGYFTVPSVANYIVQSSSKGARLLRTKLITNS